MTDAFGAMKENSSAFDDTQDILLRAGHDTIPATDALERIDARVHAARNIEAGHLQFAHPVLRFRFFPELAPVVRDHGNSNDRERYCNGQK
jgi:hypothetical protein